MQPARALHKQIANTLRDRITYGVYSESDMLPPEMLLSAEFGCSRHTVREAMKALVAEHLIERKAGRGTVVSPRQPGHGAWALRSIADLIGEFTDSQIVVLKRGMISARTVPGIAELFGLRPSGSLYAVQRIINLKQGPTAYHRLYMQARYASRIPKDKIGYHPLIEQIEKHCGVRAFRTRQLATAIEADGDVAKLLAVRRGAAMLHLRRVYFDRNDEPIECTELICRPDRYEQSIDFYREDTKRARKGP